MKKAFLILGLVAVSAAAGGLTAWTVSADRGGSVAYIEREVERTPALGTQFTSYQAEQYPDLTYAAENAVKAVVNIEAIQQVEMPQRRGYDPFLEFFGIPQDYGRGDGGPQYREQRAGGSGVIISEDGYVVTNNHVVDGASKLKVKLNDGRSFDAKLIGKDSATDLALLKVEAKGLPTLAFGSSDALRLGEWVLAIGSPFDLQSTITAGIVSAKARQLGAIPNDFRIESFIQTDAAVNPGNSGGALVNSYGQVIGINSQKIAATEYEGIGFAISINEAQPIINDLIEYGYVRGRVVMGITMQIIDPTFAAIYGYQPGIGVVSVEQNSPAAKAGLVAGDIITAIDGESITSQETLTSILEGHKPGDVIELTVYRQAMQSYGKDQQLTLKLELGEAGAPSDTTVQTEQPQQSQQQVPSQNENNSGKSFWRWGNSSSQSQDNQRFFERINTFLSKRTPAAPDNRRPRVFFFAGKEQKNFYALLKKYPANGWKSVQSRKNE